MTAVKNIVAILLCFTLVMTLLFARPSYAIISEQQVAFSVMFLAGAIVAVFIVLSLTHINEVENSEIVGWIEADKTHKYSPYLQFIPRFYFTVQIIENSLVYSSPDKKQAAIGCVYKGEEYRVKKERLSDGNLWYEIRVKFNRSLLTIKEYRN